MCIKCLVNTRKTARMRRTDTWWLVAGWPSAALDQHHCWWLHSYEVLLIHTRRKPMQLLIQHIHWCFVAAVQSRKYKCRRSSCARSSHTLRTLKRAAIGWGGWLWDSLTWAAVSSKVCMIGMSWSTKATLSDHIYFVYRLPVLQKEDRCFGLLYLNCFMSSHIF